MVRGGNSVEIGQPCSVQKSCWSKVVYCGVVYCWLQAYWLWSCWWQTLTMYLLDDDELPKPSRHKRIPERSSGRLDTLRSLELLDKCCHRLRTPLSATEWTNTGTQRSFCLFISPSESLFSFFFFFPSALFGAVVGSISALLKEWALNFYSQIPQPCSGLPWRTIGCYSGLCFGHQSLQLSIAQFLQMLSVWHSTITSFLVYPPRWNSWKHDISCHNYCFSVLQLI